MLGKEECHWTRAPTHDQAAAAERLAAFVPRKQCHKIHDIYHRITNQPEGAKGKVLEIEVLTKKNNVKQ
jgi:ubiquinone biosynthesis protein Coq4